MQPAGAARARVRHIQIGHRQRAIGRPGVQRGKHHRGTVGAMTQAQGMAQFVRHHRLEIELGRAAAADAFTPDVRPIPADGAVSNEVRVSHVAVATIGANGESTRLRDTAEKATTPQGLVPSECAVAHVQRSRQGATAGRAATAAGASRAADREVMRENGVGDRRRTNLAVKPASSGLAQVLDDSGNANGFCGFVAKWWGGGY
jgi:hypothetical protein